MSAGDVVIVSQISDNAFKIRPVRSVKEASFIIRLIASTTRKVELLDVRVLPYIMFAIPIEFVLNVENSTVKILWGNVEISVSLVTNLDWYDVNVLFNTLNNITYNGNIRVTIFRDYSKVTFGRYTVVVKRNEKKFYLPRPNDVGILEVYSFGDEVSDVIRNRFGGGNYYFDNIILTNDVQGVLIVEWENNHTLVVPELLEDGGD